MWRFKLWYLPLKWLVSVILTNSAALPRSLRYIDGNDIEPAMGQ